MNDVFKQDCAYLANLGGIWELVLVPVSYSLASYIAQTCIQEQVLLLTSRTQAIGSSYTCNVFLFLLSFLFEVLQFPNGVCGGYCYPRNLG